MTAGVPGAGIGGLFYLLAAVALPIRTGWRWCLGRRDGLRWRDVLGQLGIAAGILLGIAMTGWLLGAVLGPELLPHRSLGKSTAGPFGPDNAVRIGALVVGFGTLFAVLLLVQVARKLLRPGRSGEAVTARPTDGSAP